MLDDKIRFSIWKRTLLRLDGSNEMFSEVKREIQLESRSTLGSLLEYPCDGHFHVNPYGG
jgi:hypothetical protein